jgi:hypothetical protein
MFKNMPKFDGTGPLGQGMGTGRRMGPCYGGGYGRGCGRGYGVGYGMGVGRRFFTKKEEVDMLKEDIKEMESELKAAKEMLSEMGDKE